MNAQGAAGASSEGNKEEHIIGHLKKGDPCNKAAERLAELRRQTESLTCKQ